MEVIPISLRVLSGKVEGFDNIKERIHEAIVRAFVISIEVAWSQFVPEVAKDTNLMRTYMITLLRSDIKRHVQSQKFIYTVDSPMVRRILLDSIDYAPEHVREGMYKNPTTPGTRPISQTQLDKLVGYLENALRIELPKSVRVYGLDWK